TGPEKPALVEVPVCTPPGVSYDMTYGAPAGVEMRERIQVAAESTTTATTFTSDFVDALPILGRDYQDVLTLAPGVADADGDGNPTIHGSRDVDVITLADGVSSVLPAPPPPPPAKRGPASRGRTSGASAEYGQALGGFVNVIKAKPIEGVVMRISAPRSEYRTGEPIELSMTIENQSARAVQLPAALRVADGSARFRIFDAQGVAIGDPVSAQGPVSMMTLQPGATTTLKIMLNGAGGYRIDRPGVYRVTLLGKGLGLGNSNALSLTIKP
ncbi:MAG TPA: hypothetical protein VN898_01900, partial [Candidatus Binatia bacterium]|nr:hypothetical protein [Candidatus Binatia bacterium]